MGVLARGAVVAEAGAAGRDDPAAPVAVAPTAKVYAIDRFGYDAAFDSVLCTLSLCSIPNDRKAVAEMKRVLRPGGRLLLLDHVTSTVRVWRGLQ